jgi:hypothetical protein
LRLLEPSVLVGLVLLLAGQGPGESVDRELFLLGASSVVASAQAVVISTAYDEARRRWEAGGRDLSRIFD